MKKNRILSAFCAAAVLFGLAACADTDAQYEVKPMDAPEFISASPSPQEPLLLGDRTIKLKFNEKINFVSDNASLITFDGKPVKKALVMGASDELTITVDAGFDDTHSLHIPAGLVKTADGQSYDKDIDLTWSLPALPSNTATQMAECLGFGWNLGNHFDTSNMEWGYWDGATPTQSLYTSLAAAGVKTVRLPVTWTAHMTDGIIDPAYLEEVSQNVDWAIAAGLNIIVNTHHDSFETKLGEAVGNPAANIDCESLISSVWSQVAKKLGNRSEKLIFETFNEVHDNDQWSASDASDEQLALMNEWNKVAFDAIRANEGEIKHWIGVSTYAASIDGIASLELPHDEHGKVMVGVHCYDPYNFCLSNDSIWGHTLKGNATSEQAVVETMYKLRTNFIDKNILVYLGEFGCSEHTVPWQNVVRKYYLEFFCRTANKFGIPVMLWDNMNLVPHVDEKTKSSESHGYIDHNNGAFVRDGANLIPMMVKAATSSDTSYTYGTVWDNAPKFTFEKDKKGNVINVIIE